MAIFHFWGYVAANAVIDQVSDGGFLLCCMHVSLFDTPAVYDSTCEPTTRYLLSPTQKVIKTMNAQE